MVTRGRQLERYKAPPTGSRVRAARRTSSIGAKVPRKASSEQRRIRLSPKAPWWWRKLRSSRP